MFFDSVRRFSLAGIALVAFGCLPPSEQDLQTAQALVELGDAMSEIRADLADLQDQLDSLKAVAVRQDSIVRILANLAGVPVPR
jgi:hypothetical protein